MPEWIRKTLELRKHLFTTENFSSPSASSKAKLNATGGVSLAGDVKSGKLEDSEKNLVLEISAKLDLDEVEAFVLLKSLILHRNGPTQWKPSDQEEFEQDDTWWDALFIFYFQERLAIYDILNLLLRLSTFLVLRPEDSLLMWV